MIEKIHQLLNDPDDVVGWSMSIGFFIGLLGASWYDVLIGLQYGVYSLAVATLLITLMGAYFLRRTIEKQGPEVCDADC